MALTLIEPETIETQPTYRTLTPTDQDRYVLIEMPWGERRRLIRTGTDPLGKPEYRRLGDIATSVTWERYSRWLESLIWPENAA